MRELRKHTQAIFRAALEAADPVKAVERHLEVRGEVLFAGKRRFPLALYRRVLVVGAGKASAAMALAVEKRLGKRIETGLVNVKYGHTAPLKRVKINECGHPIPDAAGVAGSARTYQGRSSAVTVSSGPRSRARSNAVRTTSCRATTRTWPGAALSGRGSSCRSPISAASSVICAFTDASSAARSGAGSARPVSSLRASSSMFVRSDVSGVRSSCPASAISCA